MVTVTLKPDLAKQVTSLAGENQANAEAFVDNALRRYIARFRREKIRTETEAFNQQYEMLLVKYQDQYVAVHDGQVIDHDPDLRTLHLRVFERLGHVPILLKKVTKAPRRELVFRSPRFERDVP